jgi:3-deoxy-manno-octulosonate cytidylyltransferase (CMP-KDO synthetase)
MPRVIAIIPARLGSSRFPNKPMVQLAGRTMIEHVYQRARLCSALDRVYIATCDEAIAREARRFGAPAIMTAASHERASERVAEAAETLDADIVVLLQGDEPMIAPGMISAAVAPMLADASIACVNLTAPIRSLDEFEDRNTIKVVLAANGDALYFSREPIPTRQRLAWGAFSAWKQVCVIPFRRDCLRAYAKLPPTPLEVAESIDMLRLLEHGIPVRMVATEAESYAVDTPTDRERVEALLRQDPWLARYNS